MLHSGKRGKGGEHVPPYIAILCENWLRSVSAIESDLDGPPVEHEIQNDSSPLVAHPGENPLASRANHHCGSALRAYVSISNLCREENTHRELRLSSLEWRGKWRTRIGEARAKSAKIVDEVAVG